MKKYKKVFLIILSGIFILSLVLYSVFFLAGPNPASYAVRVAFENAPAKPPVNIDGILSKTITISDVEYTSDYPDNQMDIYLPKDDTSNARPVIIWVHGGAFVGGDKSDVRYFAQTLAAEGYAVFSINYQRAPEGKYPTPFFQLNDAYAFIEEQAEKYQLNMAQIFLAGDSAGAQIVGQTANALTNEAYGETLPFHIDIPRENIRGLLLYCGIFSVDDFSAITSNYLLVELFKMIGWSYFGEKNWRESSRLNEANIINHVTENFPPAFITDGNTMSFEVLAKALVQRLSELDVSHDSLFFPKDMYETLHEYQFVQDTEAAETAVEKTLAFLHEHTLA